MEYVHPIGPETSQDFYAKKSKHLDDNTLWMSGGYEQLPELQEIIDSGESMLPFLLKDLYYEPEGFWWRAQATCTIAHEIEKPIEFTSQEQGKLKAVKNRIVVWGEEHGYLEE